MQASGHITKEHAGLSDVVTYSCLTLDIKVGEVES